MKRNGILLTLLALLFMTLSLSQNLPGETNRVMHDTGCKIQDNRELCIEDRASEVFPHSEIQNPQLDKASFALKTRKLHMPFIANNGQVDERVKYYAKTFGGTVFVTKEGEIVYALPANSSECRGEWHSPNGISPLKRGTHPLIPSREGNGVCNKTPIPNDKNETHPRPLLLEGRSEVAPKKDFSPRPLRERDRGISLKEELVGAMVKAIQGEEPSITKVSYFKGKDPSKWKTNISTYDAVNLGEIYDGIELKLRAYGNNVEKLFCVKPGADPEQIKIRLSGLKDCGVQKAECGIENPKSDASTSLSMTSFRAESRNQNQKLQINKSGELEVETELGLVKFTKPVAYQEIEGKRVEVECKYTIADCGMQNAECKTNLKSKIQNPNYEIKNLQSENPKSAIQNQKFAYGFAVASYDRTKPLIIDPLLASTFLGGSGDDWIYSVAIDENGSIYTCGHTSSSNFPTTLGVYDTSWNGGSYYESDAFIAKLNEDLTKLLSSTYLGGSSDDDGISIVIGLDGNVYATGMTSSSDFPTTNGAYDTSGSYDVFVSKLDGGLTSLLASTYLGGGYGNEFVNSIVTDSGGNIYVTGQTFSSDFPTTMGAYDTSYNYHLGLVPGDAFVSRLSGSLTSLLASTYLGGSDMDTTSSIVIDSSGNIYVTGVTGSSNFPTTTNAYDTSYNGNSDGNYSYSYGDVFLSKLNGSLTTLLSSTYLGGNSGDVVDSIALDSEGNIIVGGHTKSTDFPITNGTYDTSVGGSSDVMYQYLMGH